ncbi:MAG: hypothetical protein JWM80_1443 [Cyanobacteria bacterium RYN_339]|nr:hypothetical protein [Cyanobacteria bacterium RYN_339]
MKKLAILAAAALLTGCVGAAVNQATVYRPVTGVIQMEVKIPSGESVDKVQFQVNDKVVGEDTDGADGFAAEVDTAALPVDTLAKLAAVGVRPNGSTVVLRENYILVERDDADATTDAPLPLASAAGGGDAAATTITPTSTDAAAAYKQLGPTPAPTKAPPKKKKVTVIKLGG